MDQKFRTLLLALALAAGLAGPAGAYYLMDDGFSIFPNEETYRFWETDRFQLKDQNIYEESADNWNFCGEFHDGLVLIHESNTVLPENYPGLNDNYVDKNGNLVDLNRNRYDDMYSFSEGLAAGTNYVLWTSQGVKGGVTYVDTSGNEVVPYNHEWRDLRMGMIDYVGRFENGRALVLRNPDHEGGLTAPADGDWDLWAGIEYAYIDKTGKLLTGWTLTKSRDEIINLPLYDCNGVWIGFREDPDAWAASAISYEQLYKGGGEADGGAQNPTGTPAEPFTPDWHAPELPDYNYAAPSLFASTARVTGFHLGDLDFGVAEVTITNPTGITDAGVVAVVFANVDNSNFAGDGDGVFFVPYELGPGESSVYSIRMTGIFNQEMFTYGVKSTYAEQLAGHVASTLFTFTGDDDLWNFYETVPYEQYWYPQGNINEFQPICDGQPGTDWLLRVAGISRPAAGLEYYEYTMPDGSRPNAAAADHAGYCRK